MAVEVIHLQDDIGLGFTKYDTHSHTAILAGKKFEEQWKSSNGAA